jgi:hypothetical protein
MYCTNIKGDQCKKAIDEFRDGFYFNGTYGIEKVLYEYGVDLYIGAHEHVYERFWPIYNKTVSFLGSGKCDFERKFLFKKHDNLYSKNVAFFIHKIWKFVFKNMAFF